VKAASDRVEHFIELVSEPAEEPRLLGRINDGAFPGGTIGFGVSDGEEFIVRAFKVLPLRKPPAQN
jgi:hypothetical protein